MIDIIFCCVFFGLNKTKLMRVMTTVSLLVVILYIIQPLDAVFPQKYEISDIKYPTPRCNVNNRSMNNYLGYLTVDNDLLSNQLIINYNLNSPFSSCYLCSQYSNYCDKSIVPSENIYLTTNILYNLQILTFDINDTPQGIYSFNVESELGYKKFLSNLTVPIDLLFPVGTDDNHCRQIYSFIMVTVITIDLFNTKELITISHPSNHINNIAIFCRPNPLYTQIGIDCNMIPVLHPIVYTMDECVSIIQPPLNITDGPNESTLIYYPPIFWYHELLLRYHNNDSSILLCGERYDITFFQTGLYQSICYNSGHHYDHIKKSWWTSLFIQLITLEMNIDAKLQKNRGNVTIPMMETIYEGRELLSRTCDMRENYTSLNSNQLTLYQKIENLYNVRPHINQDDICDEMKSYFRLHYNKSRDDDFTHVFNIWYIELFKFIVYPNKIVETKVLLCTGLTFFILLFIVFGIGIGQFGVTSKLKNSNGNISVDDGKEII